jgi:ribosomal protein S18 acetylase RimI-like enzyme
MHIRSFRTADTDRLYDICLQTFDGGGDGAHLYPTHPRLPGDLALGACLKFDPAFVFVLADDAGEPIGYTVGVLDTGKFYQRCEADWWPPLRKLYPVVASIVTKELTAEERLQHLVHNPVLAPKEIWSAYPSHLHINILPSGQGHGYGRALLETLLCALSAAGSPGVFLGLQPTNLRAPSFYEHLGFAWLPVRPGANRRMGLKLPFKPNGRLNCPDRCVCPSEKPDDRTQ